MKEGLQVFIVKGRQSQSPASDINIAAEAVNPFIPIA